MLACQARWTGIKDEKDLILWNVIGVLIGLIAVSLTPRAGLVGSVWAIQAIVIFYAGYSGFILLLAVLARLIR